MYVALLNFFMIAFKKKNLILKTKKQRIISGRNPIK